MSQLTNGRWPDGHMAQIANCAIGQISQVLELPNGEMGATCLGDWRGYNIPKKGWLMCQNWHGTFAMNLSCARGPGSVHIHI